MTPRVRLMRRTLGILVLAGSVAGCTSFASLVESLNERHLQSCLHYHGMVGGGLGAAGQGQVTGITATGGADLATCQQLLESKF